MLSYDDEKRIVLLAYLLEYYGIVYKDRNPAITLQNITQKGKEQLKKLSEKDEYDIVVKHLMKIYQISKQGMEAELNAVKQYFTTLQ